MDVDFVLDSGCGHIDDFEKHGGKRGFKFKMCSAYHVFENPFWKARIGAPRGEHPEWCVFFNLTEALHKNLNLNQHIKGNVSTCTCTSTRSKARTLFSIHVDKDLVVAIVWDRVMCCMPRRAVSCRFAHWRVSPCAVCLSATICFATGWLAQCCLCVSARARGQSSPKSGCTCNSQDQR